MSETPAEKEEKRAIRRRWISIGEGVAVASVVIAGLSFWNSYSERQDSAAERQAAQQREAAEKNATRHHVPLVTSKADGSGIEIKGPSDCPLESARVRFPTALGTGEKTTVVTHRIEAKWIERAMLKATEEKEGRLPVLIAATCAGDDGERNETAIYDLLWRIESGLLDRSLRLRGLVRRESVKGDGQRRLDSLWKKGA